MNRRGFFAALAGLPLAPIALEADPMERRRKRALALTKEMSSVKPWPPELLDKLRHDLAEATRLERSRARALMQTIEWT